MKQPLHRPDQFFFGTRILPCPYIPGRVERKVVTDLSGQNAAALYERLSRAGFRRSHSLAYRPACPDCQACVPVRIVTAGFAVRRSFKRIQKLNADLVVADLGPLATVEQYRLFLRYQRSRHAGGEMSSMSLPDYRAMVEDTPVDSRMIEYRDPQGNLVGGMLADHLAGSLSAVYSFFDPTLDRRSLGTYMVLCLVETARSLALPYVYLGYWIGDSDRMTYKARFEPLEQLGTNGWTRLER